MSEAKGADHGGRWSEIEISGNARVHLGHNYYSTSNETEHNRRTIIQDWLSTQPYAAHHRAQLKKVLKGTGSWLLQDETFLAWRQAPESSLFWLHGSMGTGKSCLSSVVVEDLLYQCASSSGTRPNYFYCERNPQQKPRSDPRSILGCIARQMACLKEKDELLPAVISLYDEVIENGSAAFVDCDQLTELLVKLAGSRLVTYVVVDGLDECDKPERKILISSFRRIIAKASTTVKVFIASRTEVDIKAQLAQAVDVQIVASKTKADIELFIDATVDERAESDLFYGTAPLTLVTLIKNALRNGSEGMFRWVDLSLQYVCSMQSMSTIEAQLGKLPRGLRGMYSILYEQQIGSLEIRERQISEAIFRWLLCAQSPLTRTQFISAISQSVKPEEKIVLPQILSLGFGLVVEDQEQDAFRFPHLSVREFLESLGPFTSDRNHAMAAVTCLRSIADLDIARALCVGQEKTKRAATRKNIFSYRLRPDVKSPVSRTQGQSYLDTVSRSSHTSIQSYLSTATHNSQTKAYKSFLLQKEISELTDAALQAEYSIFAVIYATQYWPHHYQNAGSLRETGELILILKRFFEDSFKYSLKLATPTEYVSAKKFRSARSDSHDPLFAICVWGFEELFDDITQSQELDEEKVNQDDENLLIVACRWNWPNLVTKLLERGWNANIVSKATYDQRNALQVAAELGHADVINLLLNYKAIDPVLPNFAGTALQAASFHGYIEVVRMLIYRKCSDVNTQGGCHKSALGAAVFQGHYETVALLLDNGGSLTIPRDILSQAISGRWNENIANMLLQHGATTEGPLYHVVPGWRAEEIVPFLVRHHTDINSKDTSGWSALGRALSKESPNIELVKLLLQHGADVNANEPDGISILDRSLALKQFRGRIMMMILEYRPDVHTQGPRRRLVDHAIEQFCGPNDYDSRLGSAIELLVKAGVDDEEYTLDKVRGRLLHRAIKKFCFGTIYYNPDLGAAIEELVNVGAKDEEYTSEKVDLALAVRRNDLEKVGQLLEGREELNRELFENLWKTTNANWNTSDTSFVDFAYTLIKNVGGGLMQDLFRQKQTRVRARAILAERRRGR